MRISKITLHGFKSYLEKTEFTGFDIQFNAITGLNGSGKSNILDAICFVLGQNAPSKFRVKTLAELVYKKGTGGINFASVVIEFDLRNSTKRPLLNGAEYAGDTLTVERKYILHNGVSKISINGHNSTLSAVHDMFRSVQLNIANPHFLIMQGRVTKVLSMRPPEIWAMVEEAAGTAVYRERRVATMRNIKAQETAIEQVQEVVNNNVKPKLAKVEEDENNKRMLTIKENEYKRKERDYHAVKYADLKKEHKNIGEEEKQLCLDLASQQAEVETLKTKRTELAAQVALLESQMPATSALSAKVEAFNERNRQAKKESAETRQRHTNKQKDLADDQTQLTQLKKQLDGNAEQIAAAETKLIKLNELRTKLEPTKQQTETDCTAAEARYIALQTGLENDQSSQGLAAQLSTLQAEEPTLQNSIELVERQMRSDSGQLKTLTKELSELKKKLPKQSAEMNRYQQLSDSVQHAKATVAALQPDATINEQRAQLQQNLNNITNSQREVEKRKQRALQEADKYRFSYTDERKQPVVVMNDPVTISNNRVIHGTLGRLARVRKPQEVPNATAAGAPNDAEAADADDDGSNNASFCCAIETALGGAAYSVVVDKADTVRYIFDQCKLPRRTTFEPLDSLQRNRSTLSERELQQARILVGEKDVWRAMDLVQCAPLYAPAVEKSLGNVWVCRTLAQANIIAYNRDFGKRAVTLDGEVVNPSGEFTSGGATNKKSALASVQLLYECSSRLTRLAAEKTKLDADIAQLTETLETNAAAKSALSDAEKQLAEYVLRDGANNRVVSITDELNKLQEVHAANQQKLTEQQTRLQVVQQETANLEQQMATGGAGRELQEAKTAWEALTAKKEKNEKQWQAKENDITKQQNSLDALRLETGTLSTQIDELQAKVDGLQQEVAELSAEYEAKKQAAKEAESHVKEFGQKQREDAAKMSKANANLAAATTDLNAANKNVVAIEQQQVALATKQKMLEKELRHMTDEHPGVAAHLASMQSSSSSTNKMMSAAQLSNLLEQLTKEIKDLEIRTDRNDTRDSTEAKNRMAELELKERRLRRDRENLLHVIDMLDKEKEMIMNKTIEKTNVYFGRIFGTLLPHATARLERSDSTNKQNAVVEGLEIQVLLGRGGRLNSLKELSGGQRSLVALSLILTLLKINPAPIYILDEIDAALDLSHTKNVGHMISKFFKQSQFVIVSLKQGMFSNANVLYEIYFRDGTSRFKRSTAAANNNAALPAANGSPMKSTTTITTTTTTTNGTVGGKKRARRAAQLAAVDIDDDDDDIRDSSSEE